MAASFVYSLVCGLVSERKHTKKNTADDKKRKRHSNWFSSPNRIRQQSTDKSLLLENSFADESGYKFVTCDLTTTTSSLLLDSSSANDSGYKSPTSTSASLDNICEICCFDDSLNNQQLDEQSDMLRKASSLSSLLRCTSIQDKSMRVTRKRRENMAKRRSKLISADEGIDVASPNISDDFASTCGDVTSTDDNLSSEEGSPKLDHLLELLEARDDLNAFDVNISKDIISRTHQIGVIRNSSMQMKSWEIRRRRKQMLKKRQSKSCDELGTIGLALNYGSLNDLLSVDSKASRQMKVRSFYI